MTRKSSARSSPHEPDGQDTSSGKTVIRVRRGALRRFDQLTQKSADLPVEIKWDRRTTDRRASDTAGQPAPDERRGRDRRQAPPFTWEVADFVVVGDRAAHETADRDDAEALKSRAAEADTGHGGANSCGIVKRRNRPVRPPRP